MQEDILVPRRSHVWRILVVGLAAVLFIALGGILWITSAPQSNASPEQFVVGIQSTPEEVIAKLAEEGFARNRPALKLSIVLLSGDLQPGGYEISRSMSVFSLARVFAKPPHLRWITIPEGLRKEEIAEILAKELSWSDAQKETWITKDTSQKQDYSEGVYFPDTYLIPEDATGEEVAARLIAKFEEVFAPYAKEALHQNIRWPTVLRVASLVQREAAGQSDMPLIAGILWNRLLKEMKLDIDATVQYARGDKGEGFWAPITVEDKRIDSPYNTYRFKGLPPHPIANPGESAIKAVLFPEKTDCFYYLHDTKGVIHCAKTYEEHQENIEKYLQ